MHPGIFGLTGGLIFPAPADGFVKRFAYLEKNA